MKNIKVYLVGGAVRDAVIGRTVKDLDFVVVGATPEFMVERGFNQVGADFPVFLHPTTGDEYALARTERKTAAGYHGFEVHYEPDVTLEEDLLRRDLTMNSMAVEVNPVILEPNHYAYCVDEIVLADETDLPDAKIIDPFNGQEDIKNGVLRHTSEAFAEDPLRVLRTARFAARYNFTIAIETQALMNRLSTSREILALPIERIFTEFQKAMMEEHPENFFHWLYVVEAHDLIFEELKEWNNDGLRFGIMVGASFEERVMLLCKGLKHFEVKSLLTRINAPKALVEQTVVSSTLEYFANSVKECSGLDVAEVIFYGLRGMNAWKKIPQIRKAARIHLYHGEGENAYNDLFMILGALDASSKISFNNLSAREQETLQGGEIGEAILNARKIAIFDYLNS